MTKITFLFLSNIKIYTIGLIFIAERMKNLMVDNLESERPKFIGIYDLLAKNINRIFTTKSHKIWFVLSFLNCKKFPGVLDLVSIINEIGSIIIYKPYLKKITNNTNCFIKLILYRVFCKYKYLR